MRKQPATTPSRPPSRRGRPRADEIEQRRQRVKDVAYAELVEHGYQNMTMSGIAKSAGASKETLYSWFGNREGLFTALIIENADASAERVQAALDGNADPYDTLVGYAAGLLNLLTDERSIALNRAAMSSPELAATLLQSGRHRVGPVVESYLADLSDAGYITVEDPADGFTLLYGLVVRDAQIRVLLGEDPPGPDQITTRAREAVDQFLRLCRP